MIVSLIFIKHYVSKIVLNSMILRENNPPVELLRMPLACTSYVAVLWRLCLGLTCDII